MAGRVFSSQQINDPGVAKHHFRLMYRNRTNSNAIKPRAAPRNVVVSMGTVSGGKKDIKTLLYGISVTQS